MLKSKRRKDMQKIICKKVYDTTTSTVVKKVTNGYYGDPAGYEETLYVTSDGAYFLYTNGGEQSKYTSENITRKSKAAAEKWLSEN
jgi:hypothetical protein